MSLSTTSWDSFWAIHAAKEDMFHNLLWQVRFLFTRDYARHIARYTARLASAKLLEVGCGSARTLHCVEHFTRKQAEQMVREKTRVTRLGGTVGIVVPWQSSVYNLIIRRTFRKHWPFGDGNPCDLRQHPSGNRA